MWFKRQQPATFRDDDDAEAGLRSHDQCYLTMCTPSHQARSGGDGDYNCEVVSFIRVKECTRVSTSTRNVKMIIV